jgi:CheY-specific phosphatase CheX
MTAIPAVCESLRHHECVGEAATNIFKSTCSLSLTPQDDSAVSDTEVVIAIISLVGQVEWSVFIGLPKDTACKVSEKFAGFAIPFDSPDMGDAVGELANILAGDVKARLDAKGVKANISLPTVIRAQDIHVLLQRAASTVKTCYRSDMGPLWIGVTAGKGGGFVT